MGKYYWLNKESRTYLSRGYLEKDETPEQRILDIGNTAEKILGISGFAEKFEDYMSRGWYSLSSPIWSNFGKPRGLPISCFSSYIGDSMESILYKAAEIGMMTKSGGGTSAYFGDLRGRGAKISSGGESTGSVHFMEIFDKLMSVVSQGNVRRGSFAAYLPVDHPDIMEFLRIQDTSHPIQQMSFGVCISDQWMEDLLLKKKENITVWKKILEKRASSGYPYLFFSDSVNRNAPQVYKDKGLKIHASNLCLPGDTPIDIETNCGFQISICLDEVGNYLEKFHDVYTRSYDVDLGQDVLSKITAFSQTGVSNKLISICSSEGNVVVCTPEHKIFTQNRGFVEAQYLEEDDLIQSSDIEVRGVSFTKEEIVRYVPIFDITVEGTGNFYANNILVSNCSEVMLSTSEDESFVCDLSSMNLEKYEEWKDTDAVEILVYFLDAVMSEFIEKTEGMKFMDAPRKFAINQRALGIGALGYHSLLHLKMIPFESMEAKMLNIQIWKNIATQCDKATKYLAELLGEPPLLKGYGVRNVTTRAIAPTTSSSFILGQVSPSVEPLNSNYFVKDLAKGKFTYKNPYLIKLLKEKDKDTAEVWRGILSTGGSVQHLDFLSTEEKNVFKTFAEISQLEIIIQAGARQKYIDQGQSINTMILPQVPVKEQSILLIEAWKQGLKTLYYQRSDSPVKQLSRSILGCSSCES